MLDEKEYALGGGMQCPHCESPLIEGDRVEVDGDAAWAACHCLKCEASWVDQFVLNGYSDLEVPEVES